MEVDPPSGVAPAELHLHQLTEVSMEAHRAGAPVDDSQEHATCEQLPNDLVGMTADELLTDVGIEPLDNRQ